MVRNELTRRTCQALSTVLLCAAAAPAQTVGPAIFASQTSEDTSFGRAVAMRANTFAVGARSQDTGGTDSGAAYVFELQAGVWTQTAVLTTPGVPSPGDSFGADVDLLGQDLLVGAYGYESGSQYGAVFVFHRTAGGWVQTETIVSGLEGNFGWSLDADGRRLLVGAPFAGHGPDSMPGSVATYERHGGAWIETGLLSAPDPVHLGRYGWDVALDGAVAVVGQPLVDSGTGAAHVFEYQSGAWHNTASLHGAGGQPGDWFGEHVAVSGGVVVAGAHENATASPGPGAVYVFEKRHGAWMQVQKLSASDGEAADEFGISLAMSNGLLLVGADYDDDMSVNSGAVYVFERSQGHWTEIAKLVPPAAEYHAWLGSAVALSGGRAVLGAPGLDSVAPQWTYAGAVHVADGLFDIP